MAFAELTRRNRTVDSPRDFAFNIVLHYIGYSVASCYNISVIITLLMGWGWGCSGHWFGVSLLWGVVWLKGLRVFDEASPIFAMVVFGVWAG